MSVIQRLKAYLIVQAELKELQTFIGWGFGRTRDWRIRRVIRILRIAKGQSPWRLG